MGQLNLPANLLKLIIKLVQGYCGNAPGILYAEGDLIHRGKRMHHVCNCADKVYRIKHGKGLGGVGHTYGHLIPRLYAQSHKALCAAVYLFNRLFVCGIAAHEIIGDNIGMLFCRFLHRLRKGAGVVVKMLFNIAVVIQPRGLYGRILGYHHSLTSSVGACSRSSGF